MTLESEQEKGATVSLYLPCAGEELGKAIPSAAETAIPRGEGELVIAAEDDAQVRETTVKRLEALGYQVIAARTGLEAIDLIKTHPDVKAVLSDVMMPGGATGYAVARWVRDNRPGVGIVLVSGHAPLVDAELVQDVVALTKPFVRVDLARAMRRAIEKSPTQDSPGAASSEGAGPRSAGEDQTVFVVDDDRNVRETIAALLQGARRAVRAFANAQAFLDSWRPEDSGCLIVDVRMPGMNGLELLARLTERKAHIPAIVITGRGDIAMAVGAMQAGAVDFLEKPINSEKLLAAVDRALKATSNDAANSAERPSAMRIAALTKRERDVLGLVVAGHANKEIAARLGISQRTVESYRAAVMKKMGARSLSELVRMEIAARR